MNELREARAELARLEERAKDLLNQLFDVRFAISRQRTKINECINQRPPAISRLPNEMLSSILSFDICTQADLKRKQQLAGVSHFWRDVILHNPMLWSFIEFSNTTDSRSIKTHIARSGNVPLNVVIQVTYCGGSETTHMLFPNLEIVVSHAHRWQSLLVVNLDSLCHDSSIGTYISNTLGDREFPALKSVTVPSIRIVPNFDNESYPIFLSRVHAPALEYLELRKYCPSEDFLPATTLKTLILDLEPDVHDHNGFPRFLYLIPTNALVMLDLRGNNCDWSLQTNSIHFPVLTMLTLTVAHTGQILQAITAPNLERFVYSSWREHIHGAPESSFGDLESKFSSVPHLDIRKVNGTSRAFLLHEAFSGVRHIELNLEDVPDFFRLSLPLAKSNAAHPSYAIDRWSNLENLSVRPSSSKWTTTSDNFIEWVKQRGMNLERPLHVKLTGATEATLDYLLRIYNSLKGCCTLEFDVPVKLTPRLVVDWVDPLLQLVSAQYFYSSKYQCETYPGLIVAFTAWINLGAYNMIILELDKEVKVYHSILRKGFCTPKLHQRTSRIGKINTTCTCIRSAYDMPFLPLSHCLSKLQHSAPYLWHFVAHTPPVLKSFRGRSRQRTNFKRPS